MTYVWLDKITGKQVEVTRKMAESHIPPNKREMKRDSELTEEEIEKVELVKLISGGIGHVGFGGKGNW